jgi:HlyD family type I secretion membrane fusion protein
MASTRAQVARLEAEHADKTYSAVGGDRYELLQQASFQQRQSEFRSSLADFDARIHSDEAKIVSLQADVGTYRQRLKVASDIEGMNAKLERDGWGSRLKTLTATDARVEVARLLSESQNQIKANAQSLQALQAQRSVYIEKFHAETTSDLVTARDALVKIQEDLKKAQKVNQLISLEAPADAIVLKVANASVGSVVGPTADNSQGALFTLVPLDDKLEAEVRIDAKDIGFLEVGDTVQVKLDAYSYIRHGTAQGVIETISEGSFTQGENENQVRSPYFKARVALTDVHLHDVPRSFRLIPGMTVVADVMIGKRTILSYLVDGALRTGSEAMREP